MYNGVVRYFIVLLIILIIVIFLLQTKQLNLKPLTQPTPIIISENHVLGDRTKTAGCVAQNDLPDSTCTPGDIFPNATVAQICRSGYSSSVRNVTIETKRQVYAEYGILTHKTGEYEVDHLIPLEVGGSNDISNLWPEAAEPRPGFHEKDGVENYLHQEVCAGRIVLSDAQKMVANDWLSVYKSIPNPKDFDFNNKR